MTSFMKFEVIAYYVLKVFGYACGILGALGFIGFAGGLEHDNITILQFIMYELHAFMLMGISYLSYYIREVIVTDFSERAQLLRRRARRTRDPQYR